MKNKNKRTYNAYTTVSMYHKYNYHIMKNENKKQ